MENNREKVWNIAIIGCGDMGRVHAACLSQLEPVRLYAFCDQDPERTGALQRQYPDAIVTSQPEQIFADRQVDVVYIATHTGSHKALCLAAIQAHKHLMIEKPVALTAADARAIWQAVHSSGLTAMVALKFRFYQLVQKARRLMPEPFMVSVQVMDDPWPPDFWANDPQVGGGNVISQGVHGADLLRFLAGAEPDTVFAMGGNYHQPTGVVDNLSATFRFRNGCAGTLVVGDCGQPPGLSKFMVQIFGALGTSVLSNRLSQMQFHERETATVQLFSGPEDGFSVENRTLIQILNGEIAPISTVWDGFVAQAMIEAAIQSAKTGTVVSVPG